MKNRTKAIIFALIIFVIVDTFFLNSIISKFIVGIMAVILILIFLFVIFSGKFKGTREVPVRAHMRTIRNR